MNVQMAATASLKSMGPATPTESPSKRVSGSFMSPRSGGDGLKHRRTMRFPGAGTSELFSGSNWICTSLKGKLPERRSNMAHFIDPYTHNLYVFGGQDLKEGLYNSLWRISLQDVRDNMQRANWEHF